MGSKNILKQHTSTYQSIESFLDSNNVGYQIIKVSPTDSPWKVAREKNIPYKNFIRSKLIKNRNNIFLIVTSIDRLIDFKIN